MGASSTAGLKPRGAGATFDAGESTAKCALSSPGTVTCDVGKVVSGSPEEVHVLFAVGERGTQQVVASVSGNEADPDPANNVAIADAQFGPPLLRLTPATASFGIVPKGQQSPRVKFTVTNRADSGVNVVVGTPSVTGAQASQFKIGAGEDFCTGQTLAPGGTCIIRPRFAPTISTPGPVSATLSVPTDQPGSPLTAALNGVVDVSPIAHLWPDTANFGSVQVGRRSAVQNFKVTNKGGSDLEIGTLAVSAQWQVVNDACSDTSLAPAAKCVVKLRFAPTQAGETLGNLFVPSNAAGSPASAALSGVGT
ncbi:MAG TPA: choice-of-anchor D domain-containing protein [Capillimicrobium sp.]|nr:choice-of-anchor D domain-containing protein [Capillimicrobium sp.]